MRIPGLYHLILLLRRSPVTEYERVMLLHRLHGRRHAIAMGAVVLLAATSAAIAAKRHVDGELECLALNVYFESRGEPYEGQAAVANVVMNRVADDRFPGGVCAVVQQGGKETEDCQFSWWCDRLGDRPKHKADWEAARDIARIVYWGWGEDLTGGALWYHATYVKAYWRGQYERGPTIGNHIFYRDKPEEAGT
ncbi:MAG: cell wall hydrolase [Proteobacteria bacterium]|nr:cell wall hydrolase [Pseudomonadota bacterium]